MTSSAAEVTRFAVSVATSSSAAVCAERVEMIVACPSRVSLPPQTIRDDTPPSFCGRQDDRAHVGVVAPAAST